MKRAQRTSTGNPVPGGTGDEHIAYALWELQQWAACSGAMRPLRANTVMSQGQPGGWASALLLAALSQTSLTTRS